MPVDREHSRIGRQREFGGPMVWKCPGCGVENIGRPEQGCPSCGSGDPTKGKAPTPPETPVPPGRTRSELPAVDAPRTAVTAPVARASQTQETVVYRLIEYIIRKPEDVNVTLRNSLVGTLEMGWGTITATIVDSLDATQQDRLKMAKRQPGVWLANPEAMDQDGRQNGIVKGLIAQNRQLFDPVTPTTWREAVKRVVDTPLVYGEMYGEIPGHEESKAGDPFLGAPFTGVKPAEEQQQMAQPLDFAPRTIAHTIARFWGPKLAYTLALGLQAIAEELDANQETEKLLSKTEALELAGALLGEIPDDWQGDAPPAAPDPQADQSREAARMRAADVALGSVPTAVPWKPPVAGGKDPLDG